ncbi:MAG: 4-hydroxythreonine-4-phosphate dehydrogenase [Kiritimatiellia bacterium]|jgi:4-phospho-D-threonate 3-dehydrogenase / 4-phospho-D-erythronate 3-dehydrogenase
MEKPLIAVTMGDPAGVGPEVCLELLADTAILETCTPVIYGDLAVLQACAQHTGKTMPAASRVRDFKAIASTAYTPGTVNAATGLASYTYITEAIDAALAGEVRGVSTAPINKEALKAAGISLPGHTEIFAERTKTERACMMLTADIMTCSFVTVHVGYHEVSELLTTERILEVIELTRTARSRMLGREPRIVVCGLNPHAGEGGLFGNREEERIILPAVEQARAAGCMIEGPLPPDTAFLDWRRAETDAHICMYHDQGHIIMKALAFDRAVNTTLGLPIVRTSVDHGTALDIAWQGKAHAGSLFAAVRLATQLATGPT